MDCPLFQKIEHNSLEFIKSVRLMQQSTILSSITQCILQHCCSQAIVTIENIAASPYTSRDEAEQQAVSKHVSITVCLNFTLEVISKIRGSPSQCNYRAIVVVNVCCYRDNFIQFAISQASYQYTTHFICSNTNPCPLLRCLLGSRNRLSLHYLFC